ncbi:hypothetical protein C0V75_17465 [Tabrizicola sp. TH137]|uniref:hypothetical protein n=1 Tax=Tabrizicola sp. TH137 TaxID=2067452 RepID=UPI000C7D5A79|nr:hypothetical protein [Tabrizicola sp. TH137]PLL11079.1 hypothetical protein C0V75_17465 [Tabrizicola sp. TH137]
MNGASKILTVSYGTFSCTLEGFDDPFNTMKAIAEYFRDLAAEDRYFGAEPPTPDAAMLHRIAEREIQRRVEAKIQENGVVLRASEPAEPMAPAPVAPPVSVQVPAVAPVAERVADAPAVAPALAPAAVMAGESVVEKLMRLRSDVAAQPVAEAPVATSPVVSFAIPDYVEDMVEDVVEPEAMPEVADLSDLLPESLPEAAPEEVVTEAVVEAAEPAEVVEEVAAEVAAEAMPEAEVTEAAVEAVEEAVAEVPAEASAEVPGDDDLAAVMAELGAVTEPEAAVEAEPEAAVEVEAEPMLAVEAMLQAEMAAEAEAALQETAEMGAAEMAGPEAVAALNEEADAVAAPAEAAVPAPETGADYDVFAEDEVAAVDLPEGLARALAAVEDEAVFADAPVMAQPEGAADLIEAAAAETAPEEAGAEDEAIRASLDALLAGAEPPAAEPVVAETAREEEAEAEAQVAAMAEAAELPPEAEPEDETPAQAAAQLAESATNGMELRPGAQEKLLRARARVIRIRKSDEGEAQAPAMTAEGSAISDYVTALAETAPVEAAPEAAPNAPAPAAKAPVAPPAAPREEMPDLSVMGDVEMILSAEDEAALQRELAALTGPEDDAAAVADLSATPETRKGFDGPSADEAVSRLMKQTDNEMEGSEAKRRLSAIQHLRAAVAATVAERKVTGEAPQDNEKVSRLARYRNDLAMAVKNVLPGRGGDSAVERPAPLVLVSEQRIDRPRPAAPSAAPGPMAPVAPVRPRRVASSGLAVQAAESFDDDDEDGDEAGNMFGDTRGFAEFVERVGAQNLEQILEAAAAYLSGVEGREHFSRPALMQNVAAVVPSGSFQREDGLRSFGALLRKGRIAKIRRGQFTLTEESAYLAEARKIAG